MTRYSSAVTAWMTIAVVTTGAIDASTVRPVNIESMTSSAERIVVARCIEARAAHDAALDMETTTLTFDVSRTIKGGGTGSLTVKVAGRSNSGMSVPGFPWFRPGAEVVLFLHGTSRSGFTSPVGLGQGKFAVFHDKGGRTWAANEFGNQGLFRDLSPRAVTRLGGDVSRWRGERAIPLDSFVGMVQALVAAPGSGAPTEPAPPRGRRSR